ncbi:TetR/AcrR family transcriptional regulator [Acinetobacter sp. ANC 5579]|nr:TetR/AcrR family transcriptional regulator [Acinetobacter amyesii]MCL6235984.1 TetR/AcrR family transcriptional regulator [Acinetobacter amyesii]
MIRDESGVSKATLYNYFPSKEELFLDVMMYEMVQQHGVPEFDLFEKYELTVALKILAKQLITVAYSKSIIATRRMLVANASHKNLGQRCYEKGPKRGERMMCDVFQKAMDDGILMKAEPRVVEAHFRALVDAEFSQIFTFGLDIQITAEWIEAATERAVDVLMRAYQI